MKKRFAALCLTCSALLSLSAPAAAVRAPNDSGQPQSSTGNTSVTIPSDGTLSFDQIGPRVKANNLTLKAAQESLKSAEAMDWDEAIDEMEDAIDAMELQISMLVSSGAGELANAKKNLEHTLKQIAITEGKISNVSDITDGMFDSLSLIALGKYSEMQAASLKASLESMEDQLDDLQDQKEDYQKTLEDTARQIDYAAAQTIAGAESLYLTILSTQLQLEALQETMESTQRSLREVELRYELGQVSQLTLLQAQSGYDSLKASMDSLENTISTLYSSLQSLMGDVPTGRLTLTSTPYVTQGQLAAISYTSDLEKAKENSYTLYASARSVEDAKQAMDDARREEGKNSYQYKMAEYTYQSTLYQNDATIAEFELSFNPSTSPRPAQAALSARRVPRPMRNRSTPWQSEARAGQPLG
ncbi:MAG: TolC family protein [Evtepia gabavorous]